MNSKIRTWLLGICLFLLAGIWGYSLYNEDPVEEYEKRYTFISPMNQWNNIASGIAAADKDLGTNTKLMGAEKMDINKQVEAIENELLMEPDGIITAAPVESEELKETIQRAQELGIPVVLLDSDLPDSGRACYVGIDNMEAGRIAARELCEATGGTAKIGVIVSDLQYPNQQERVGGFREVIAQCGNMEILEIVESHSERLEIMQKVPDMLNQYPEMDALYITEAIASSTVGTIIEEDYGERQFQVVAFDNTAEACAYVERQLYYALITQDPVANGYQAVEVLSQILEGREVESTMYTEARSMKQENLAAMRSFDGEDMEWHIY